MVRKTNAKKTYPRKYKKAYKPNLKVMVRNMIQRTQETKQATYTSWTGSAGFSYGSGASVGAFFGPIPQGAADSQRIGSRIFARGMQIRLAIQPADNTNYVRVLVVQAKPGMAPPIAPGSTATFVQNVLSNTVSSTTQWLAPVDTERYQVLYDKNYFTRFGPLDGNSGSTIINKMVFVKTFLKINRLMVWDDSGNMNNDVYLIMLSDSAVVNHPGVVAGFVRVFYKDA